MYMYNGKLGSVHVHVCTSPHAYNTTLHLTSDEHWLNRIRDLSVKRSKKEPLSDLCRSFQHFTAVVEVQLCLSRHLDLHSQTINKDIKLRGQVDFR